MFRNFHNTRVLFDLEDLPEEWYTEDVILCVPRFAWMAARTFLKSYGLRNINYAASYGEEGYYSPDAAQFDKIDSSIGKFLEGTDMSCDLESGLLTIAAAIDNLQFAANVQSVCCVTVGSGEDPPVILITEGDSPPPGWEEPAGYPPGPGMGGQPEYYDRKCKVANAIHENIRDLAEELNANNVGSMAFPILTASIGFLLGFATPIPMISTLGGAVVGFVTGLVLTIFEVAPDTAQLVIDLDDNEEALVCALFTAADSQGAINAYIDVLESAGTSVANVLFLQAVMVSDFVIRLFLGKPDIVELKLEDYVPAHPCDCLSHFTERGTQVSDNVWDSLEIHSTLHSVAIAFYSAAWQSSAEPSRLINIPNVSIPGYDPVLDSHHGYRYSDTVEGSDDNCPDWTVYCDDPLPVGMYCVKRVFIRSKSPFTVTFTFGTDC